MRKQVWKVFRREVNSNGRPFPYQHDEVTRYWLTTDGQWSTDDSTARCFDDYHDARRHTKAIYGAQCGKFSVTEVTCA